MKNLRGKQFLRNAFIFALITGMLFLIDFLIKHYLFEMPIGLDVTGPVQHENALIGVRSYAHSSTTFMSFINHDFGKPTWITINMSIFSALALGSLFIKQKAKVIAIGIIAGGVLGNSIDVVANGYVRDVLYTPWLDRGTFNLADLLIVVGGIALVITILVSLFKDEKNRKKKEEKYER